MYLKPTSAPYSHPSETRLHLCNLVCYKSAIPSLMLKPKRSAVESAGEGRQCWQLVTTPHLDQDECLENSPVQLQ